MNRQNGKKIAEIFDLSSNSIINDNITSKNVF